MSEKGFLEGSGGPEGGHSRSRGRPQRTHGSAWWRCEQNEQREDHVFIGRKRDRQRDRQSDREKGERIYYINNIESKSCISKSESTLTNPLLAKIMLVTLSLVVHRQHAHCICLRSLHA